MDKKIAITIAVVIVFLVVGGTFINSVLGSINMNDQQTQSAAVDSTEIAGLQSKDIIVGAGDEALPGKEVTVNYTGVFTDGTKFDSSLDRGVPFTFVLGSGLVIKGWDQGVEGMKVGGKRILIVPPELAYGDQAVGPIPANSTLIFEIELLGVK